MITSNTPEAPPMKRKEGNMSEQTADHESLQVREGAERILRILGLPDTILSAAIAAVEVELKRTRLSMDGVVQSITTAANRAERVGVERAEFLGDFLAQTSARKLLGILNLPINNNFVARVAAVVKAEANDTGLPLEDAANRITQEASEARRRGEKVDIFYFEDVRWRSNGRVSKAEQRKLDNLEVNAKVKQRIRERLGAS
jgi:hypothetical protein